MACDSLGIKTVYANDLKPEAALVYGQRFGDQQLDVEDIRLASHRIPLHDLLTAGFPCQPFSSAGKKQGIRDPRGTLFQEIVDIVARSRPKYFVLENVKRLLTMEDGSHFATILAAFSELDYRIEWRLLNAKDFGLAQNRERVVICGVQRDEWNCRPNRQPFLASSFELDSTLGLLGMQDRVPISEHSSRFPTWGLAESGSFVACNLGGIPNPCPSVFLRSILERDPPIEFDFTDRMGDRVSAGNLRNKFVNGVEIISNESGGARMGYTIFGVSGISPTLTASTSRHYERYRVGDRFRRLTPTEYARLQGFPDRHCDAVSQHSQYELLGNAVPPPMAEWAVRQTIWGGAIDSEKPVERFESRRVALTR